MWFLQIWFISFLLLAIVLGAQALDLSGLSKAWSAGVTAAVSFGVANLWYFFAGKELADTRKDVREFLVFRVFTSRVALRWSCVFVSGVVVLLGIPVFCMQTLVVTTSTEDPVTVFLIDRNGHPKRQGEATKDGPFKGRFFVGERTFRFQADGYKPKSQTFTLESSFLGDEKRIPVILVGEPRFEIDQPEPCLFPTVSLPEKWRHEPALGVQFKVRCLSPTPFQITSLAARVKSAQRDQEWSFPDFGEASGAGAASLKGYAKLRAHAHTAAVQLFEISSPMGKGKDPVLYELKLLGEPGYSYQIEAFEIGWTDVLEQTSDKSTVPASITLNFERDWKKLLSKEQGLVRIIYNCRVSELRGALEQHDKDLAYRVLVADLDAGKYFDEENVTLPRSMRLLDAKAVKALEQVIGKTPERNPRRPCCVIILDEQRMLLQDATNPEKGQLVKDAAMVGSLVREFDELYKQAGP